MISESPLMNAVQMTNPGQGKRVRESYRLFMTDVVTNWPTVLENDDLVIKSIP